MPIHIDLETELRPARNMSERRARCHARSRPRNDPSDALHNASCTSRAVGCVIPFHGLGRRARTPEEDRASMAPLPARDTTSCTRTLWPVTFREEEHVAIKTRFSSTADKCTAGAHAKHDMTNTATWRAGDIACAALRVRHCVTEPQSSTLGHIVLLHCMNHVQFRAWCCTPASEPCLTHAFCERHDQTSQSCGALARRQLSSTSLPWHGV